MIDPTYYYTLSPLATALTAYAAMFLVGAFFIHMFRASWKGVFTNQGKPFPAIKDAVIALFLYVLVYAPFPNPNVLLNIPGFDVDLTNIPTTETTFAIVALEKVSVSMDELTLQFLAGDVAIRSLQNQAEPPSTTDIIYEWVQLRAQFLLHFGKKLVGDVEVPTLPQSSGNISLLDAIKHSSQLLDLIYQQIGVWLFSLGSTMMLYLVFILLMIFSGFIYLIAGIFKYAPIYIGGVIIFFLPFGYIFSGMKFVVRSLQTLGGWVLIKPALIVILWIGFSLAESIVLNGLINIAPTYPNANNVHDFESGYLYTSGGSSLVFGMLDTIAWSAIIQTEVIIDLILLVLVTIWATWRVPRILLQLTKGSAP